RHVAEELIGGRIALGGEIREVSVLFADIRGFTALTEAMDPTEIVRLLNEHMSALTKLVHGERGLVDKFVGDALMAIFGAPLSGGDDARAAVRCAWRMLREREAMNARSNPAVGIGIGIASGPAVAGCMGSEDRLNYTVLGSRVNLASRLCGAAGAMELWIDDTTYDRVRDVVEVEPVAKLSLKGFTLAVPAYRVRAVVA
ncbi:MAG: adenylate/guanylate cyclase domain-containing protein, partial [Candidatus Binatia bacterium]